MSIETRQILKSELIYNRLLLFSTTRLPEMLNDVPKRTEITKELEPKPLFPVQARYYRSKWTSPSI